MHPEIVGSPTAADLTATPGEAQGVSRPIADDGVSYVSGPDDSGSLSDHPVCSQGDLSPC